MGTCDAPGIHILLTSLGTYVTPALLAFVTVIDILIVGVLQQKGNTCG